TRHLSILPSSHVTLRAPGRAAQVGTGHRHYPAALFKELGAFAIGGALFLGDATDSEKSMMYRTALRQKMQGVSVTVAPISDSTFNGNERKHSVHVNTM